MNTEKMKVHFIDSELVNATNPVSVNLIGAGGTGSKVLTALLELDYTLVALGHAGLDVRVWDDDRITEANMGRQRFADGEVGLFKSVALINRANRWAGTNWKAESRKFGRDSLGKVHEKTEANIYITCVDNVKTRFEVAEILHGLAKRYIYRDRPRYWLDFGNSRYTGQAILSTIGKIQQPNSQKYEPVETLPFITDEYPELLKQSEENDDTPSCSLQEALEQQDLYINGSLAQLGCSLLWNLFRDGFIKNRGFFHNLKDFRTQPIPIS